MGKYEPLTRYLEGLDDDSWDADFASVERVLGFRLPDSAYQYQAWWANQAGSGHSQTQGWQDAGFETRNLNLSKKRVRFERVVGIGSADRSTEDASATEVLVQRAMDISGVFDREKLIQMALTEFIRREAGRQLALLGGTMPELEVPSRERPAT